MADFVKTEISKLAVFSKDIINYGKGGISKTRKNPLESFIENYQRRLEKADVHFHIVVFLKLFSSMKSNLTQDLSEMDEEIEWLKDSKIKAKFGAGEKDNIPIGMIYSKCCKIANETIKEIDDIGDEELYNTRQEINYPLKYVLYLYRIFGSILKIPIESKEMMKTKEGSLNFELFDCADAILHNLECIEKKLGIDTGKDLSGEDGNVKMMNELKEKERMMKAAGKDIKSIRKRDMKRALGKEKIVEKKVKDKINDMGQKTDVGKIVKNILSDDMIGNLVTDVVSGMENIDLKDGFQGILNVIGKMDFTGIAEKMQKKITSSVDEMVKDDMEKNEKNESEKEQEKEKDPVVPKVEEPEKEPKSELEAPNNMNDTLKSIGTALTGMMSGSGSSSSGDQTLGNLVDTLMQGSLTKPKDCPRNQTLGNMVDTYLSGTGINSTKEKEISKVEEIPNDEEKKM